MGTKHTPGPWQHRHLYFLHICDADENGRGCAPIARVAGGKNGEARAEARANASLIAAAPDLLAALATLCDAMRDGVNHFHEPQWPEYTQARAAIAKATGSAQ